MSEVGNKIRDAHAKINAAHEKRRALIEEKALAHSIAKESGAILGSYANNAPGITMEDTDA